MLIVVSGGDSKKNQIFYLPARILPPRDLCFVCDFALRFPPLRDSVVKLLGDIVLQQNIQFQPNLRHCRVFQFQAGLRHSPTVLFLLHSWALSTLLLVVISWKNLSACKASLQHDWDMSFQHCYLYIMHTTNKVHIDSVIRQANWWSPRSYPRV